MRRPALLAALANAEALVASLRAALDTEPTDEHLDAKAALEQFGIGRDGLLAAERRGELELTRGSRNRILVSRAALEGYVRRPHAITKARKARSKDESRVENYDDDVRAELRLLAGGAR